MNKSDLSTYLCTTSGPICSFCTIFLKPQRDCSKIHFATIPCLICVYYIEFAIVLINHISARNRVFIRTFMRQSGKLTCVLLRRRFIAVKALYAYSFASKENPCLNKLVISRIIGEKVIAVPTSLSLQ